MPYRNLPLFIIAAVAAAAATAAAAGAGCARVKIDPIHITVDINIKIDNALSDFFTAPVAKPSTLPASTSAPAAISVGSTTTPAAAH